MNADRKGTWKSEIWGSITQKNQRILTYWKYSGFCNEKPHIRVLQNKKKYVT